jgi:L-fuconolactonase
VRIDAHHHEWDLAIGAQPWTAGTAVLERSYLMAELRPQLRAHRIDATVLVQSRPDEEDTRWLLQRSAADPEIAAVVGWVDLSAPDVGDRVAALRADPGGDRLVGVRHPVQGEPDPRWLARADVRRGLQVVADAGLTFDLLVTDQQLPAADEAVRACPDLRFVLDHAGNPPPGDASAWRAAVRSLAAAPNVAVKLSGLVTRAPSEWSVRDLQPWADTVLDAFGAGRTMFGSDWPVCLLAADYGTVVAAAERFTDGLSRPERDDVFGGAAARWYGMSGR